LPLPLLVLLQQQLPNKANALRIPLGWLAAFFFAGRCLLMI